MTKKASRWSARAEHVGTHPERRQRQFDHIEPVEQVLAERTRGDGLLQVAVGRRDQPHVRRACRGLADTLVLPLLEKPEQLGLKAQRQVADLVEEQRAALGCGDLADRVADGTCEGASRMAEQVALQRVRDRGWGN